MNRNEKMIDPKQPDDKADLPPTPPHDPIESDPLNRPVQPRDSEPGPAERPDLDWAEHED